MHLDFGSLQLRRVRELIDTRAVRGASGDQQAQSDGEKTLHASIAGE